MAKQKGLGKGLGALLEDFSPAAEAKDTQYRSIALHRIEPNPDQPRQDFPEEELQALADSISVHGLIQPLTVRETRPGYYQIIAGERRWRACRLAGLTEVNAVVLEADDQKTMELALIENLQRQDLNAVEEALGFRTLMDTYGMTQEEVATQVAKSRSAVANSLRLLSLPPEVLEMVRNGRLSAGHARTLVGITDRKLLLDAAQRIINMGLSVRQAESLAKTLMKKKVSASVPAAPLEVDYNAEAELALGKALGRKVKIIPGKRKGKLELEYYSPDDLLVLVDRLMELKK